MKPNQKQASSVSGKKVLKNQTEKIRLAFLALLGSAIFAFGIFALSHSSYTKAQTITTAEERAQLEQQLKDLENQIDTYNGQIADYKKQGATLKGTIGQLDSKIAKLNLQIKAAQIALTQLNEQIGDTETRINIIQGNIESDRIALSQLLRNLRAAEDTSVLEVLLKSDNFSDFFGDVNNLTVLQDSLRGTIQDITDLKGQLEDQRNKLVTNRADLATAKLAQQAQKNETQTVKQQQSTLLQQTKGQEAQYQKLVSATKAQAAKIRDRLFELLGGGQMSFGQAYALAKVASDATGVRPAFLLAVLDRESALGQNVGRCSYHQSMNPLDKPVFLAITGSLGIDPEKQLVSCANADGQYGGAMGPAQFIPRTWQSYVSKIISVTGRSVASPWNNADAFVAAALYLRDAGAASNEKIAAAKYYCGPGGWTRYVCTQVYGQRVVDKAAQFESDIANSEL